MASLACSVATLNAGHGACPYCMNAATSVRAPQLLDQFLGQGATSSNGIDHGRGHRVVDYEPSVPARDFPKLAARCRVAVPLGPGERSPFAGLKSGNDGEQTITVRQAECDVVRAVDHSSSLHFFAEHTPVSFLQKNIRYSRGIRQKLRAG